MAGEDKKNLDPTSASDYDLQMQKNKAKEAGRAEEVDKIDKALAQRNVSPSLSGRDYRLRGSVRSPEEEAAEAAQKRYMGSPEEEELAKQRGEQYRPESLGEEKQKPKETGGQEKPAGEQAPQEAGKGPISRGQDAVNKLVDKGKQLANEFKKKLTKQLLKAVVKSPYFWIAVAIILAIIIVIVIGAAFYGQVQKYFTHGPSPTGTTQSMAASPIANMDWISEVLFNAKDPDVLKKISQLDKTKITNDLNKLIANPNIDEAVKAQAQNILNAFTSFSGPGDTENGKKIIDGILELQRLIGTIPNYPSGKAQMPLKISGYANYQTGVTPHGLSFAYPKSIKGHDLVIGRRDQYIFTSSGVCDAVDIYLPENLRGKGVNGTKVYPLFAGKVVAKWRFQGTKQTSDVVIINDDHGYSQLFTDIDSDLQVGQTVDLNTPAGWIPYNLFHLQVSYKGRCMATTKEEMSQWDTARPQPTYGNYMLNHLKEFVGAR